jgi:hypothetical protein
MSRNYFGVLISEEAERFFNETGDSRQLSAALALHMTWLSHSSRIGRGEQLVSKSPVDMLLLYRAGAATFQKWPPDQEVAPLPQGGQILNRDLAEKRILSLEDGRVAKLAAIFAQHVVVLSASTSTPQDLEYLVELFLY